MILLSFSPLKGIFKISYSEMESLRIPVLNSDAWTPKTSSEPIGIHARVRVKSSIRLRQVQIIKRKLSFSCLLLRLNLPTSGACLGSGRSRRGLSAASRGDPNKSAFSRPRLAPWNVPAPPECLLFTPHLLLDASSRFSGLAQRFRVCYKYPAFCKRFQEFYISQQSLQICLN